MKKPLAKPALICRRAYTLVELLVVMAIVSLLVALLFPVLGRAREQARRAVCASNLHQLGLAYFTYASDSSGRYPTAVTSGDWPWGAFCSDAFSPTCLPAGPPLLYLAGYISAPHIFYCPSATWIAKEKDFWNTAHWYLTYSSYAYYGGGYNYYTSPPTMAPQLAVSPKSPASTILSTDLMEIGPGLSSGGNHLDRNGALPGGHTLYNDGSVRWRNLNKMKVQFTVCTIYGCYDVYF